MEIWQVVSSNGVLRVGMNGKVHTVEVYPEADDSIMKIEEFDMKEWEMYYNQTIKPGDSIDILTIGYWTEDGHYEPPIKDYREETKNMIVMG